MNSYADIEEARNASQMSFFDHLRELRRRLIGSVIALGVGFIVGYALYDSYISWLLRPILDMMPTGQDTKIFINDIQEGFTMKIRISVYAGLVVSLPVHLYNIVSFIMPALLPKERRFLRAMLVGSVLLLIGGVYMGYDQVLPMSIKFLSSPAFLPDSVEPWLGFRNNVMFAMRLLFAFAILFQTPLVLVLLMALNLVRRDQLLKSARYIIVLIFVISAVVTPPDFVSQIGLSLPLIVLFYLSILIAKVCRFGEPER